MKQVLIPRRQFDAFPAMIRGTLAYPLTQRARVGWRHEELLIASAPAFAPVSASPLYLLRESNFSAQPLLFRGLRGGAAQGRFGRQDAYAFFGAISEMAAWNALMRMRWAFAGRWGANIRRSYGFRDSISQYILQPRIDESDQKYSIATESFVLTTLSGFNRVGTLASCSVLHSSKAAPESIDAT